MSETIQPATRSELRHAEVRSIYIARLDALEWRDASQTGDGSYTFNGHAAVFNQVTTLYKGRSFSMTEEIATGAFDDVLAASPDVHFNLGHDMNRVMARTGVSGVGGLELSTDPIGLRTFSRLSPDDPDVVALEVKMRLGLIDQMSFKFQIGAYEITTTSDETGYENDHRRITTVSELYDVCACAQGAYPQTDASLRSLCAAFGRASSDLAGTPDRRGQVPGDADPVAPVVGSGSLQLEVARAKAQARESRIFHEARSTTR